MQHITYQWKLSKSLDQNICFSKNLWKPVLYTTSRVHTRQIIWTLPHLSSLQVVFRIHVVIIARENITIHTCKPDCVVYTCVHMRSSKCGGWVVCVDTYAPAWVCMCVPIMVVWVYLWVLKYLVLKWISRNHPMWPDILLKWKSRSCAGKETVYDLKKKTS